MMRRPPRSALWPYTPLFRSGDQLEHERQSSPDLEFGPHLERFGTLVGQLDGLQPRLLVRQGRLGSVLARMVIELGALVDRDQEGMGIASKRSGDRFADQRDC